MRFQSPAHIIQVSVLMSLVTVGLCCWLALTTPWLGLALEADMTAGTVTVRAVAPDGPSRQVPVSASLLKINSLALAAVDLVEEPDLLNDNTAIMAFFARQGLIAQELSKSSVDLAVLMPNGQETVITVYPREYRPVTSLPVVFWVQVFVGVTSFLISAWVWSLRQNDWGARCFVMSGISTLTFACAATVYSTRELALGGDLFKLLSTLNYSGAATFGIAIPAMFLVYPKALVKPKALWIVPALFAPFVGLEILQRYNVITAPFPSFYLPPTVGATEMLLIVALVVVQWIATRKDPHSRAVLRWLGLSIVICAGAFISLAMLPLVMQENPQVSQGWMFVFFLLIYIGLALGLRRYRLFDLDTWAFRIIFYMGALILFIVLDAAIIYALNFEASYSTGLSILVIGILYLPLRDYFWRRMVGSQHVESHMLFHQVIEVAFTGKPQERVRRWQDLLQSIFDPLEIREVQTDVTQATVQQDGADLLIPALAGLSPVTLRYSHQGRSLFSPGDLKLARQIVSLMRHAEKSRDAYERGKTEERKRIAQDLHDDIGAGLLTSLHTDDVQNIKSSIRKTISDMRTVVGGLIGGAIPLSQLIAAMRHETHMRLEAAGIKLDWPLSSIEDRGDMLDYSIYKNYISIHREIISNIIMHSGATLVDITLDADTSAVRFFIADNGRGMPKPDAAPVSSRGGGNGLKNMQRRASDMGGAVSFLHREAGCIVEVRVPLDQREAV